MMTPRITAEHRSREARIMARHPHSNPYVERNQGQGELVRGRRREAGRYPYIRRGLMAVEMGTHA